MSSTRGATCSRSRSQLDAVGGGPAVSARWPSVRALPVLSVGAILFPRPGGDGLRRYAADAPSDRRPDRRLGTRGRVLRIVIGAFGKLMPPEWRSIAFGAGTAAGSFRQFFLAPRGRPHRPFRLAGDAALCRRRAAHPAAVALAAPRQAGAALAQTGAPRQSVVQALIEAFGHTSYVLLVLGFFTCGLEIFFIAVRACPGLSGRPRTSGRNPRLGDRHHRPVQHRPRRRRR